MLSIGRFCLLVQLVGMLEVTDPFEGIATDRVVVVLASKSSQYRVAEMIAGQVVVVLWDPGLSNAAVQGFK